MIKGTDVSIYQPHVNWKQLVLDGFGGFSYARSCEGMVPDAMHWTHILQARAEGVPIGSYQFGHPSQNARSLAEYFVSRADWCELRLVYDMESLSQGKVPENAAEHADEWCEIVKSLTGTEPIIYSSTSYWNTMVKQLGRVVGDWWDWWCAEYDNNTPDHPATKWLYVAHQYAGNVLLAGQTSKWDLDCVYAETIDALRTIPRMP